MRGSERRWGLENKKSISVMERHGHDRFRAKGILAHVGKAENLTLKHARKCDNI